MKIGRIVLSLTAVAAVLAVVLFFGAGAWIESAVGKRTVEAQLSAAAGLPVRLDGSFEAVFLPAPGVSGTDLLFLDPDTGEQLARSKHYQVELAPLPLASKRLVVERLQLEWLTLGEPGGSPLALPGVTVSHFEVGKPSGLLVDLGGLGKVEGEFTWWPDKDMVALALGWATEGRELIDMTGQVAYSPNRADFDGMDLRIAGQLLQGGGCFLAGNSPELNLELTAHRLDLDALESALPGGQGGSELAPFDLNLRVAAKEMVSGDLRARDTLFEIGAVPVCP